MTRPAADRRPRTVDEFRRDYRVALLRYLPHRSEVALTAAYELGRRALDEGFGLVNIVVVHHEMLAELLGAADSGPDVVQTAGTFLAEVLGSHDMAQRQLHDI